MELELRMADQIFARVRAHLRPQTVVLTEARKALKGLAKLESTLGQLDLETRVGEIIGGNGPLPSHHQAVARPRCP